MGWVHSISLLTPLSSLVRPCLLSFLRPFPFHPDHAALRDVHHPFSLDAQECGDPCCELGGTMGEEGRVPVVLARCARVLVRDCVYHLLVVFSSVHSS